MRRVLSSARPDWPQKVSSVGLTYHTHESPDGPKPYWCESACYEFTLQEIDKLERAIGELHHLLIEVADHVVERGLWDRLAIPPEAVPLIERSWEADDFSLYGRFDLAFRPGEPPKLLEYNADTPTALVEAAVAQWYWLQEVKPGCDQFNSLHERLIAAWKRFGTTSPGISLVDFASVSDNLEDEQTVSYLMDTAMQAGFRTRWTAVNELGYDQEAKVSSHGCMAVQRLPRCLSAARAGPPRRMPWSPVSSFTRGNGWCARSLAGIWRIPPPYGSSRRGRRC